MLLCQEDYQRQLLKIKKLHCCKDTKIILLSALVQQLRLKLSVCLPEEDKKSRSMVTQDTVNEDIQNQFPSQIADLEQKIILKRDVKIELNQEIEEAEQELESIEKTVFVKQQMDDQLKRKIDMRMFEIEVGAYQQKQKQTTKVNKNKTFSIFSRKVLDFFN